MSQTSVPDAVTKKQLGRERRCAINVRSPKRATRKCDPLSLALTEPGGREVLTSASDELYAARP